MALFFPGEVAQWVGRTGCPVVVGAEAEQSGCGEQWVECLDDGGDGFGVAKVVTGVDNEVWCEFGEFTDPQLFEVLVGQHVEVGDVEDAEFLAPPAECAFVEHGDGGDGEAESAGSEECGGCACCSCGAGCCCYFFCKGVVVFVVDDDPAGACCDLAGPAEPG